MTGLGPIAPSRGGAARGARAHLKRRVPAAKAAGTPFRPCLRDLPETA